MLPNAAFLVQDRDLRILRGLLESRVMTQAHVSLLFFSGREHAARKRLQVLKSAGLIAERPRMPFERAVLHLTKSALCLLRDRGALKAYPPLTISAHQARARVSDITIRHELDIMNIKAALCGAIEKTPDVSVAAFITWPQLIQFECSPFGVPALVKPDGFLRITIANEGVQSARSFYLELDRSTEAQTTLLRRAHCYLAHFKSGGFAVQNGARRADFRDHPFRVLFVLKSAERRNNLAEALLGSNPPILTHVWLSTLDEVVRDPLGAIWIRPIDYRDAVAPTQHAVNRRRKKAGYRRSRQRDAFVERQVAKRALLS